MAPLGRTCANRGSRLSNVLPTFIQSRTKRISIFLEGRCYISRHLASTQLEELGNEGGPIDEQNSFAGSRSMEPYSGADGEATGPTRLT
jgi:hypothetical protein